MSARWVLDSSAHGAAGVTQITSAAVLVARYGALATSARRDSGFYKLPQALALSWERRPHR